MSKWLSSVWTYENGDTRVDREKGIIYNAAICTPGEAKGHGVQLDSEFVASVVEQGNASKNGLKMRYGHPSMSSTAFGTFIGRAKNFREEGGVARGDIFMSKEAKNAPGGDLYEYVLGMAENEADMFGTSIVFKPGKQYSRDEDGEKNYEQLGDEPFIECDKLLAVDMVDDPAANPDGLFSNTFNTDTMAGQVSEFLDTHPQVWEVLCEKPEIIEGFMAKYKEFRSRLTGGLNNEGDSVEPLDATASVDAKPIEEKLMEKEVIKQINDEFGAEILAQTMLNDGDYESAKALHADAEALQSAEQLSVALDSIVALEAQVVELTDKLEALSQGEDEAVPFEEAPEVPETPAPVDVKAEIKSRTDEGMSAKDAQDAVAKEHPEAFKAYNGER
jgi:hypothetical protein